MKASLCSLFTFLMLLSGCASSLNVDKLQDFKPVSKNLVFLTQTEWDGNFRVELARQGFKVLKMPSINTVVTQGQNKQEIARLYSEAEARYGISITWQRVDMCIYNSSRLIDVTMEVTDMKTNEVLMVVKKGGWTGPCLDPRDKVFEVLAKVLANEWR